MRGHSLAGSLAALMAVAALLGGCGIGVDGEPRALRAAPTTTTTTPTPSTGRAAATLYYVHEGTLVPASTELPDRDLTTVLTALLLSPPSNLEPGGTLSSIPAGTELLGIARDGDRLTVNLSAAFDNVVGLSRQQAIGQMVLTATERNEFSAIDFQVDSEPIRVSSPLRGDTPTVTACDFAPLLATPDEAEDASLSDDMIEVLVERRASFAESC